MCDGIFCRLVNWRVCTYKNMFLPNNLGVVHYFFFFFYWSLKLLKNVCANFFRIFSTFRSKKSSTTQPIVLFTYSDDNRTGRKTRDAKTISRQYRAAQQNQQQRRRKNHRNKNKRRNLCARHNMFVDFTDVGWNDWIVAPPGTDQPLATYWL